jgi:hypothetical protein
MAPVSYFADQNAHRDDFATNAHPAYEHPRLEFALLGMAVTIELEQAGIPAIRSSSQEVKL